jgi:hypothetical protein
MPLETMTDRPTGATPSDAASSPMGLRNIARMFGGQVVLDDVSVNLASRFQSIDSAESRARPVDD